MGGAFWTVFSIILVLASLIVLYVWFIIRHSRREKFKDVAGYSPVASNQSLFSLDGVSLLTVLGSGGHTTEMLTLLGHMSEEKYVSRTYVVANSDTHSERKVSYVFTCSNPDFSFLEV